MSYQKKLFTERKHMKSEKKKQWKGRLGRKERNGLCKKKQRKKKGNRKTK